MAKRSVNKEIIETVEKYINEVRKDYDVNGAYLFGSYANGTFREESDIDVAIILNDFDNCVVEMAKLGKYAWNIDTRIEPHPIRINDFNTHNNYFVNEIINTGIKLI